MLNQARWLHVAFWTAFAVLCTLLLLTRFSHLGHRSLWADEIAPARIASVPAGDMTATLKTINQPVPPGFGAALRPAYWLAGDGEAALRTPVAMAGVLLALVLALGLARRQPYTGLLAGALIAVSPVLVAYSRELKQYIFGALTTALLLVLLPAAREKKRALYMLGAVGAIGCWLDYGAALPTAAVLLVLLVDAVRKRRDDVKHVLASGALCAASFALLFVFFLLEQTRLAGLYTYHHEAMARAPWSALAGFFVFITQWNGWPLLAVVAGIGVVRWLRRENGLTAAFALVSLALAVVVNSLKLYPFYGRLSLWAAPLFWMAVAAGWTWPLAEPQVKVWIKVALAAMLVTVVAAGAYPALNGTVAHPELQELEELRPVVQQLAKLSEEQPLETVWVYRGARWAWQWYSDKTPVHADQVIIDSRNDHSLAHLDEQFASLTDGSLWLIFSHYRNDCGPIVQHLLDRGGQARAKIERTGAQALLVEFSAPSP